jgi:ABC-type sugar transport system substrate-binding protein
MKKRLSLLLDQADNIYQQLLAQEAARSAAKHGLELAEPHYAGGSSVAQMEYLMHLIKSELHPDGVLLLSAGSASQLPASKRAAAAGISLVYLNRVPPYLAELRRAYPAVLIAAVAPDQSEVGRIQAAQCKKLLPNGGYVLLITGTPDTSSAIARREAFLEAVGPPLEVHVLDGLWTEESAFKALSNWYRIGADRDRKLSLVVCQNDEMGRGARRALAQQAALGDKDAIASVPVIGCDGLPPEGQALVQRGELSATVVLPPTTPRAVEMLTDFWTRGARSELALLPLESFPAIDQLRAP